MTRRTIRVVLFVFAVQLTAFADTTVIDFESLADQALVTNQYSSLGVTFSNAIVLAAGQSLNEFDFPPHSGSNVVGDLGGPITLTFSSAVFDFSGYFTYTTELSLAGRNTMGTVVSSTQSSGSQNFTSSGGTPNEFIDLSDSRGFLSVTIQGNSGGGSFTMDDISFSTSPVPSVPEPASLLLVGCGLGFVTILRIRN